MEDPYPCHATQFRVDDGADAQNGRGQRAWSRVKWSLFGNFEILARRYNSKELALNLSSQTL